MKLPCFSAFTVAAVAAGLVRLAAQTAPDAPPVVFSGDPRITINRISAAGSVITVGFADNGTGAASYRLEWLPRLGGGATWAEIPDAQAAPATGGRFQFTVSVQGLPLAFFRVRGVLATFRDTDGDGLDDDWERRHFGSLDALAGGDPDRDGYTNLQEYRAGTDPTRPASQPGFPLVTFAQPEIEATEGTADVRLNLTLNKPWTGQLHFAARGSAVSGRDFVPPPATLAVVGTSNATLRLRLLDNREFDPIRWLRVELVETAAYGAGRNRAVTVTLKDNDEVWQGAFVSRLGRVNFGLKVFTHGQEISGSLVSTGGALPASPPEGFRLASLATSATAPHLAFDSGWLPLSTAGGGNAAIWVPGMTHVRLTGRLNREANGRLTGNGNLEIGTSNRSLVTAPSQSLELALAPASFVAGKTNFVP